MDKWKDVELEKMKVGDYQSAASDGAYLIALQIFRLGETKKPGTFTTLRTPGTTP
jgi:hypothetical protein